MRNPLPAHVHSRTYKRHTQKRAHVKPRPCFVRSREKIARQNYYQNSMHTYTNTYTGKKHHRRRLMPCSQPPIVSVVGLVVHHQATVDEVETIRARFEGMLNHFVHLTLFACVWKRMNKRRKFKLEFGKLSSTRPTAGEKWHTNKKCAEKKYPFRLSVVASGWQTHRCCCCIGPLVALLT